MAGDGWGCGVSGVNTHLSGPLPTALINKYNINLASLLVHKKSLIQFLALHLSLGFHYLLSSLLTCYYFVFVVGCCDVCRCYVTFITEAAK